MRWLLLVSLACVAVPRTAMADDCMPIAAVSALDMRVPDNGGGLDKLGHAYGASMMLLRPGSDAPVGFEASTLFLRGKDGERLYDLGLAVLVTYDFRHELAAPMAEFGLDLSASSLPRSNGGTDRGVMAGVHGGVGLHGLLGNDIYWRAMVGYHGAGIGALVGQVSLGYRIGGI
jgi:hypothetical protein